MRKTLFILAAMLLSLVASAQIREEGETRNGLKEGTWYEIDLNKNLIRKVVQYKEGKKDGLYLEIYDMLQVPTLFFLSPKDP